ncbi:uncharacterized protein DS421_2g45120 [Arachis hypogaea]|nr:uncharacterized protein DS421_2g45120 [Arachis hypogaea]
MSTKMTSSKDKGKRLQVMDHGTTQNYKLRFLKPVIRPSMFKLSLPITPDDLPNRTPYLDLVMPDGRNNPCWCFWSQLQSGKIALTRGWEEFYQIVSISLLQPVLEPLPLRSKASGLFCDGPNRSHVVVAIVAERPSSRSLHWLETPYHPYTGPHTGRSYIYKPGGVGVFEVISTEPVTIIQVRYR